jgi:hypothetical protein
MALLMTPHNIALANERHQRPEAGAVRPVDVIFAEAEVPEKWKKYT